ncbi:hypothetical protein N3K66_004503 [Trichothecium roseum]|uniref:Uncharacterized protein n=1 Tax=Trichothecium roseum TaxID=47278 RepID=A0ACC0V387_9HYPO|nr:hypothetical protein N3K66_004503 [Trichothecium roseum]
MPAKLPLKYPSARVKSPAPRPRPSKAASPSPRPASPRRSRSHGPAPRDDDAGFMGRRPSRTDERRRDRSRLDDGFLSPDNERDGERRRRRRRDSTPSPPRKRDERRDGERRKSYDWRQDNGDELFLDDHDVRRNSSVRAASQHPPSLRPGGASGTVYRDDDKRQRPSTPDRYKPEAVKDAARRTSRQSDADEPEAKTEHNAKPPSASHTPVMLPQASGGSASALFNNMPSALATYAGIKAVTKHADVAKEWVDWLRDLGEAPEEIDSLSAKATTARDTISQVQEMLKKRPDLLEGERGEQLKEQIEDSIQDTDKSLGKMTKLLSEISKKGVQGSSPLNGLQEFWRSYQYKDNYEDKVKQADEELQRELMSLSTLMMNLYSRSAIKSPPVEETKEKEKEPGKEPDKEPVKETEKEREKKPVQEPAKTPVKESTRESGKWSDKWSEKEPVKHDRSPSPAKTKINPTTPPVPRVIEPEAEEEEEEEEKEEEGVRKVAKQEPSEARMSIPADEKSKVSVKDTRTDAQIVSPPPSPGSSPSPRPPSAVGKEEEAVGSPPASQRPLTPPKTDKQARVKSPSDETPLATPSIPTPSDTSSKRTEPRRVERDPDEALLRAAKEGDLEGIKRALRHGSIRCCDIKGKTPLHLAAQEDRLAAAMLLLDRGADVHARSDGGRTPLHLGARDGSAALVETLLERAKADPNALTARGRTPLHYAASEARDGDEERREVLRVLRDWGADPTVEDKIKQTPRDVAQERRFYDAASTLRRAEKRWEEDHKQNWLRRHNFMK